MDPQNQQNTQNPTPTPTQVDQPNTSASPNKPDPASIYPNPVDHSQLPTNQGLPNQSSQPQKNNRYIKIIIILLILIGIGVGAYFIFGNSKAKQQTATKTIAGNYTPDFTVFAPTQFPDSSYYLEGIITPETKPIGTQTGVIMLQYRSKNVPKNSDYTLDTSIIQIKEEKKKNGYQPPTSCANLDAVPTNKTSCKQVGTTSDGKPIYLWPSTAVPLLYFASSETFMSISMPGNKTVSTDELAKIASSLKQASYNDLLNQAHP